MLIFANRLCKVCIMDEKRKRINMTLDAQAWRDFQVLAKGMRLSASRFVEILIRSQLSARSKSVDEVLRGLYSDLIEARNDLTPKERDQMGELFKDDK
jgi:hypothetical protein